MKVLHVDSIGSEYDTIVDRSDRSTFYHTQRWLNAIRSAYPGMTFRCIVAQDGNDIVGVLPYFEIKRRMFLSIWSLPFATYGGPVTGSDHTADASLIEAFNGVARHPRVIESGWVDYAGDVQDVSGETTVAHIIDLSTGFDEIWEKGFSKKRRQRSRGAERSGVTIRRGQDLSDLRQYYDMFARKMAGWGNDGNYPYALFESLFTGDDNVRLYLAEQDGIPVAGHFNLYYRDSVTAWFNMTSDLGDELQASSLLYTHCIRGACEEGFRTYNLGSSIGKAGLIRFKESLGARPYEYRVHRQSKLVARIASALRGGLR